MNSSSTDPVQAPASDPTALSAALWQIYGGQTLAELDGVPQDYLESLYEDSCDCVDREDFEGALQPLLYLVMSDPYDFRFQFGFGLCLHQLGRTADAAKHYGLAWLLDPRDAGCAFRLGECHLALGDREAAEEAFRTAIELSVPPATLSGVRAAAEEALSRMNA